MIGTLFDQIVNNLIFIQKCSVVSTVAVWSICQIEISTKLYQNFDLRKTLLANRSKNSRLVVSISRIRITIVLK